MAAPGSAAAILAPKGRTSARAGRVIALKARVKGGAPPHSGVMARPTKGAAAAPATVAARVIGALLPRKTEKAQPTSVPLYPYSPAERAARSRPPSLAAAVDVAAPTAARPARYGSPTPRPASMSAPEPAELLKTT
eukprot:scaffold26743_cov105-Isochrysis_galbana.AAC.1